METSTSLCALHLEYDGETRDEWKRNRVKLKLLEALEAQTSMTSSELFLNCNSKYDLIDSPS